MWNFYISSSGKDNWPKKVKKEVCFIGRSNVGKSSLINAITNRKKLARTSNTPGRTQLINYFYEEKLDMYLVDLPGYGYAKMSKSSKEEMLNMLEEYFTQRKELLKVYLLIDSRQCITKIDKEMINFITEIGLDIVLVATKIDKAKQKEKTKLEKELKNSGLIFFKTSSNKKINTNLILDDVVKTLQ
ncbi:MAG: ribosome biogenesis GTP-binding protein YihA/YsxC [Mollicutes bacterium PWAP]|nr:ribosome biogenesis GTP-binding protein YihA/YsxC [Mollicutes bacterium PWAP]